MTATDRTSTDRTGTDPAATDWPTPETTAWHHLDPTTVLRRLESSETGLSEGERAARLARYGPNRAPQRSATPLWREVLESFTEPLQLLLIVVAVLSAVFGELSDAIAIAVVIAVVAGVETATERRAARAIDALGALSAPTARVVHPWWITETPAADLVPGDVLAVEAGDVLAVEAGDVLAADARVLTAAGLRIDESTLTGEPAPVGKDPTPVPADAELAERSSVLHAGTAVVTGQARAVVVATAAASTLGHLGRLVETTREPRTALQQALAQLARIVLVIALTASVAVTLLGVAAGQSWREMLLAGLTVAFATVPEELPILVVVLLAVGGRALAGRGALLRRLRAGETLGAVTTVVTDKTGTLTENHLRLVEITGDPHQVLTAALACQSVDGLGRDPFEVELAAAAHAAGIVTRGEPVAAFEFDPTRKLASRAWRLDDTIRLAVCGAPENVLDRSDLTPAVRAEVDQQLAGLTRRGLRVLAVATRDLPAAPTEAADAEAGLSFLGLVAFADPLRPGVADAVAALHRAGVATLVVTGDHPDTAAAVGTQVGLPPRAVLHTARDLDPRADDELAPLLGHGTVIARATPATKHRVVQLLQRRGEVVAVTGDGANDAPALAAADVGIAMGRRGTDLARAAADLVLTDDVYPTVTAAVAAGRNITAQLRRAVAFYLGAKLALVVVLLAALGAGRPSPFAPIHIVLLEIFMDLGASVAFVAEPAAPAAMRRPPRRSGTRFLDRSTLSTIAVVAATLSAATLPAFLLTAAPGAGEQPAARAAAVLAWLTAHALIAWTLRTQPALSWRANPAFPAWAGLAILTGLALTLTPAGGLVDLNPLPGSALLAVAACVALAVTLAAACALAGRAFAARAPDDHSGAG